MKKIRLLLPVFTILVFIALFACKGECTVICEEDTGYSQSTTTITFPEKMKKETCEENAKLQENYYGECSYDFGN